MLTWVQTPYTFPFWEIVTQSAVCARTHLCPHWLGVFLLTNLSEIFYFFIFWVCFCVFYGFNFIICLYLCCMSAFQSQLRVHGDNIYVRHSNLMLEVCTGAVWWLKLNVSDSDAIRTTSSSVLYCTVLYILLPFRTLRLCLHDSVYSSVVCLLMSLFFYWSVHLLDFQKAAVPDQRPFNAIWNSSNGL